MGLHAHTNVLTSIIDSRCQLHFYVEPHPCQHRVIEVQRSTHVWHLVGLDLTNPNWTIDTSLKYMHTSMPLRQQSPYNLECGLSGSNMFCFTNVSQSEHSFGLVPSPDWTIKSAIPAMSLGPTTWIWRKTIVSNVGHYTLELVLVSITFDSDDTCMAMGECTLLHQIPRKRMCTRNSCERTHSYTHTYAYHIDKQAYADTHTLEPTIEQKHLKHQKNHKKPPKKNPKEPKKKPQKPKKAQIYVRESQYVL